MASVAALAIALAACDAVHLGSPPDCGAAAVQPPPAAPSPAAAGQVRVISWNVHGPHTVAPMEARIERIARELLRRRPAIVLLQEVWFEGDAGRFRTQLAADYENVNDPEASGGFLSPLLRTRKGGLLAFVRRGGPWRAAGPAKFLEYAASAPFWQLAEADGLAHKGVQLFELEGGDGRLLLVFNTHLQAQYGKGREYEQERRSQLGQLMQVVDAHPAAGRPWNFKLIGGDFNTPPTEKAYADIGAHWQDLAHGLHKACNCGTFVDANGVERSWLDFQFGVTPSRGRIPVAAVERITSVKADCPYSDHHGLQVDLQLPAR